MNKKQELLVIAEALVRQEGYNSVSFRTLAKLAGIKSASVHYHFPTKEDLGAALAERYTDNFLHSLSSVEKLITQGYDPISTYITRFREALLNDKKMCLCGMLGAEFDGLPEKVRVATQSFFTKNIDWLTDAYQAHSRLSKDNARHAAISLLTHLEGTLLVSTALKDDAIFDIAMKSHIKQ